ncbi:MAG: plastocyanin [Actinobacteria bacterium]|nr:plastocyanin [Actinomycetota bacterium]
MLAVGLVAAALGAPPAGAVQLPADEYEEVDVQMLDNDYIPQTLTLDAGTNVVWTNDGRTEHNVIPDDSDAGWKSNTIKPDKTYDHLFDQPGVYGYFCSFHGAPKRGMYGTVIVKNADGTVPKAAKERAPKPRVNGKPRVLRVAEGQRIQKAVDKAAPGDMVLIEPGVYEEAVTVTTDRLVLRGLDRNKVILDGGYTLDNGVKVLDADGVAVENMTARRYTRNGFFWTGVTGYRGSYLTTTRTGDYGVYAFDSTDGIFEHSFASGSPDAGYYIGQCNPCNAVIRDVFAEWNGLGYSGTNASGNLYVIDSVWTKNRAGIVPNSGDGELLAPQHDAVFAGNLVIDNNNDKTPAIDAAVLGSYNGIIAAGANGNLITKNRVIDHEYVGIGALPNPDKTFWSSNDNTFTDNVVEGSGLADLGTLGGDRNCFAGNTFETSRPANIEQVYPCPNAVPAPQDQLPPDPFLADKPPSVDYRKAKTPKPPKLPGMRNPAKARPRSAVDIVIAVDVDAVELPDENAIARFKR